MPASIRKSAKKATVRKAAKKATARKAAKKATVRKTAKKATARKAAKKTARRTAKKVMVRGTTRKVIARGRARQVVAREGARQVIARRIPADIRAMSVELVAEESPRESVTPPIILAKTLAEAMAKAKEGPLTESQANKLANLVNNLTDRQMDVLARDLVQMFAQPVTAGQTKVLVEEISQATPEMKVMKNQAKAIKALAKALQMAQKLPKTKKDVKKLTSSGKASKKKKHASWWVKTLRGILKIIIKAGVLSLLP